MLQNPGGHACINIKVSGVIPCIIIPRIKPIRYNGTGLSPILAHPFSNIKFPLFALEVQVGAIPKH